MSSGFISEVEIAAAKQKRQDEWEKVRQADQPLEVEEETYDSRSLYDRLKEQKDKKDYEFEEAHKLKNLIRGLDDDEVDFLDVIDKAKSVAERRQQQEENKEMREFREKVASMQEKSLDNKIQAEIAKPKVTKMLTGRQSQKNLLSGLVRKRPASTTNNDDNTPSPPVEKKASATKVVANEENVPITKPKTESKICTNKNNSIPETKSTNELTDGKSSNGIIGGLHCIGILPGIGRYKDSSDSEKSTDTDEEYDFTDYDWVGRKIKKHQKCE